MQSERDVIKSRLDKMLMELLAQDALGQSSQKTVELDQQAVGRLSRMDAIISQSMGIAQQNRRDQAKARIKAALKRLENGDYGYCLDCGDEIGEKRLAIDPTLPKCLSCTQG